jgi:hypothetical protein
MLYSPTLHGIRNGMPSSAIGSVDAKTFDAVVLDASSNAARRMAVMDGRETSFLLFSMNLTSDTTTAPTSSITVPRFQIGWPFQWAFKGGFASCFSGNTAAPGVNIGVYRNGANVFTNSPGVSSLNALVISGTALLGRSNYVAAHASHAIWSAGDRIEIYNTAGAANWRGGAVYLEGTRMGGPIG